MTCSIECDGTTIPDTVQVVSIETTHAMNQIPQAIITILDGDMPNGCFPVSDQGNFTPGTKVVIRAGYDEATETIFSGVVIKHTIKIDGANDARLIIDCRDKALAMTVARKNAHYTNQTDQQIIATLINNTPGLSAAVGSTGVEHKQLAQYYMTDWDYMMARADANGFVVTVDAGIVSVKPPLATGSPVLTLRYGTDLMEFEATLDAQSQLDAVTATSWDSAQLATIQNTARPVSLNAQGDIDALTLAQVLTAGDLALQTSATLSKEALAAWSKAGQIKAALARIRGRLLFQGCALAKPGALLELAGVGKHFNGNIMASQVRHRLIDGNWTSEVDFGMPVSIQNQSSEAATDAAVDGTAGIRGLHVGIVLTLDADPEGQHRIEVSVPIMNAPTAGVWARLAHFYASSGFGAFVVPEVGDEVVLGFFDDAPSCPVILGSLYSSKHNPPLDVRQTNSIKALVTRSKLKVEFDDDKKVVTIVTPANNTIVISDDSKSIYLHDQNNNKVELGPDGIVLDSAKDVTIQATGSVYISAMNSVDIVAAMNANTTGLNITHTANVSFVAKGSASAEISAAGVTTVKGAMVMIN